MVNAVDVQTMQADNNVVGLLIRKGCVVMVTLTLKLGLTCLLVALVVLAIERTVFALGEIGRKVFQISLGAGLVFLALQIILWLWIFL